MQNRSVFYLVLKFLFFLTLLLIYNRAPCYGTSQSQKHPRIFGSVTESSYKNCTFYLESLNTSFQFVIFDENVLAQIQLQNCEKAPQKKIEIGVDDRFSGDLSIRNDSRFEIIFFTNSTERDYLSLQTKPMRIIPKFFERSMFRNIIIPSDVTQFHELFRRSKFVDCLGLHIPRKENKKNFLDSKNATLSLAKLRNELMTFGMFPVLNGGTLLGWYRECNIIPHTRDMDLAVFYEESNKDFVQHLLSNSSEFKLLRKMGMLNDSFELAVSLRDSYRVDTDIFVLYTETLATGVTQHWVGGMSESDTKFKFTYPKIGDICAANLFGHIFWVVCSPHKHLEHEYGKMWYKEIASRVFIWYESGNNVEKNGQWTEAESKIIRSFEHIA